MKKNADKTTTFTEAEVKSIRKLIAACHEAISSMTSGGDLLGWDNYRALQMWDGKLKGNPLQELSWFIDEEEDATKPKTVDEWLDAYGKAKKG